MQIAQRTGQSQPEVSEIIAGRRVVAYDVLARIAESLGVPREQMGMSWWAPDGTWHGPDDAYPEGVTVANLGIEMISRRLLGAGTLAVFGQTVFGESGGLPAPIPSQMPLPGHLGASDVAALRDLTTQLRAHARLHGGQAHVISGVACHYERLMTVDAADAVHASLGSALAELHNTAGWACYDSGQHEMALRHFGRALALAREAGDGYRVVNVLWHAGAVPNESGQPGHALKLFELAQIGLAEVRDDPRAPLLAAYLRVESACSLAQMGRTDLARSALAAGRGSWEPPNDFERANMNWLTSVVGVELRQLDAAESFASAAVHAWEGVPDRRQAVLAEITLATVHVRVGEPRGLELAHGAITSVSKLSSVRARQRLLPLAAALDARASNDARDMARMIRQLATTRL